MAERWLAVEPIQDSEQSALLLSAFVVAYTAQVLASKPTFISQGLSQTLFPVIWWSTHATNGRVELKTLCVCHWSFKRCYGSGRVHRAG
ncbi:hypothetical protein C8R47DRAFT_97070 [Mycena vitilis]|nr:hypothetical protein C8R47DRAFT_97070 [Mycena vitilis]